MQKFGPKRKASVFKYDPRLFTPPPLVQRPSVAATRTIPDAPPPPVGNAPPPPPPPPMPPISSIPAPSPPPTGNPSAGGPPVPPPPPPNNLTSGGPPPPPPLPTGNPSSGGPPANSRDALLLQIQGGLELKSVNRQESSQKAQPKSTFDISDAGAFRAGRKALKPVEARTQPSSKEEKSTAFDPSDANAMMNARRNLKKVSEQGSDQKESKEEDEEDLQSMVKTGLNKLRKAANPPESSSDSEEDWDSDSD